MNRLSANARGEAKDQARGGDDRALPDDQQQNRARRGAQRHANAQLARALRDEVRHHAVDADRRQAQGERRQTASAAASRTAARPATCSRASAMLVTRYIGNSGSSARICWRTLSVSASGDRLAADDDSERARRKLQVRQVHRRARVGVERVLLHGARPRPRPSSTARWSWRRTRRGGRAGRSGPRSGHNSPAMRSSITTTRGALRMSCSPNRRPRRIGICIVRK